MLANLVRVDHPLRPVHFSFGDDLDTAIAFASWAQSQGWPVEMDYGNPDAHPRGHLEELAASALTHAFTLALAR